MVERKKTGLESFERMAVKAFSKATQRQRLGLDAAFRRAASVGKNGPRLAEKALTAFNKATDNLLRQEARHKTRDRWQKLSLVHYLRSPEHMAALRNFEEAKKGLLKINPATGQKLIDRAEEAILAAVASVPARRLPPSLSAKI